MLFLVKKREKNEFRSAGTNGYQVFKVTMGIVTMVRRLLRSISTLIKHPRHSEMLLSKICPANEWKACLCEWAHDSSAVSQNRLTGVSISAVIQ